MTPYLLLLLLLPAPILSQVEEQLSTTLPPGSADTLPPDKKGLPPLKTLLRQARTTVELTCLQAYRENMLATPEAIIETSAEGGLDWCQALDETPTATKNTTYVLLLRMKLKYVGPVGALNDWRNVYFYIVATRSLYDSKNRPMTVLAIIPRIPCVAIHREAVTNIQTYTPGEYFTFPKLVGDERDPGCHDKFQSYHSKHIYVSRMMFTGSHSNHLFLFGRSLVQSTDGGKSFVHLWNGYPKPMPPPDSGAKNLTGLIPLIEVMAFDTEGDYAFTTNRKELYIGSTGDIHLIRLRPSEGYSMMQTMSWTDEMLDLYSDHNQTFHLSVKYDKHDVLHEILIVSAANYTRPTVKTRRIPVDFILRFQKFYDRLEQRALNLDPNGKALIDFVYDDPAKWSQYCPSSAVKFYENYVEGVTGLGSEFVQEHHAKKMEAKRKVTRSSKLHAVNDHPALWASNLAVENVEWKTILKVASSSLEPSNFFYPNQFDRWLLAKQDNAHVSNLKFVGGANLAAKSKGNRLLSHYYLDYGKILRLELTYAIKSDAVVGDRDFQLQREDTVQLNVDNPNGTVLQVDTEKVTLTSQASVKFVIHISITRSDVLIQSSPGKELASFHLIFHLINRFGSCVKRLSDPFASESLSTVIYAGCRPSTDLIFNWNRTLYSIQFKDRAAHYGRGSECYNNEFVCFFARIPFVLFFDVYDIIKQTYVPYTGNYIMRIIAGGYKKDSMTHYTKEEQHGYNIPGVSDVSLIWNEWDTKTSTKIERELPHYDEDADVDMTSSERVLKAGVSAIQWACHTLSPCARVVPNAKLQTIFWFRILITNRDVENNTLCLYEKEFDLMLYGFPPSPETQLLTTIIFCLFMLGILYVLFICLRGHKKVWRATRLKMSGWYLIVRDTFPKVLKTHEEQNPDEMLTQQQKDQIILSLQGHLKIPPLVPRHSEAPPVPKGGVGPRRRSRESNVTRNSSQMSFGSEASIDPEQAEEQSGWTDMVYEQIISKRLAAIVEKNKKMRANMLRRTSHHDTSIQQEKRYEQQHKKTIAEESLFTGKPEKKH